MFLLYVDESGDTGHLPGATQHFVLSGMAVHERWWHKLLESLIDFRRHLRRRYGLKLREEIHCKAFLHKPGPLARIPKSVRLQILRDTLDHVEKHRAGVRILNVIVDKAGKAPTYDVFDNAWRAIIQRFHNTIEHANFPAPNSLAKTISQERGLLVVDQTDEPKLRALSRRLRRYNPIPSRYSSLPLLQPLELIVEDAVHRDSSHSYILQVMDVVAYFLYQRDCRTSKYVSRKGGKNYFSRLKGVLCKEASTTDPEGIVRL